jgi:hypothetical protein
MLHGYARSRLAVVFGVALTVVASTGGRALDAQQADVIRGRITAEVGEAVTGATVRLTSIPNNVNKATKTDKTGRYTITFQNGDGE